MRLLLDSHVLLWWLFDSARISARARKLISDPGNDLFWSAASSWELAIKAALGRLRTEVPLPQLIPEVLREQSIQSLPVEQAHALHVASLPAHHRDPFDRLLVAQCRIERLRILSADDHLDDYGVERRW